MPLLDLASPIATLIDRIVPDANQRAQAKLALLTEQGALEMQTLQTQMSAIVADAGSRDPWTSRARPTFLYVMCDDPVVIADGGDRGGAARGRRRDRAGDECLSEWLAAAVV